jgi:cellulose biosynthesis protein BcsQ
MSSIHLDEIREKIIKIMLGLLVEFKGNRIVLIHNLYGKFGFVIYPDKKQSKNLRELIISKTKDYLSWIELDQIWVVDDKISDLDKKLYDSVWAEGESYGEEPRLRIVERYRTHGAWLGMLVKPPWSKPDRPTIEYPPIIAFYSFKGGVGRTTALAAFAIDRARAGERVVVIDADLDAPGIGTLLASDAEGTVSHWGVVDYMLEKRIQQINFWDYYHACRRDNVTGAGEILVIPAGEINSDYTWKLSRLDMEPYADKSYKSVFYDLIEDIRNQLKPNWILIDVRAGLAIPAGVLISGFAHLNVVFGTSSEQSWKGLKIIVERLGKKRVLSNQPQEDLLLVHAMVPRGTELAKNMMDIFNDRARDVFTEYYYAEGSSDTFLTVEEDLESSEAPHIPIAIQYDEKLTSFRRIDDVVDFINDSSDYKKLSKSILNRFVESTSND